jgi:hypothetical protein
MSLPLRWMTNDRRLRNRIWYLDNFSQKVITLHFTEGHNMVIRYDDQEYSAENVKLVVRTPDRYLFYPIDILDARLKDVFENTKNDVESCHADHGLDNLTLYFEWDFTRPLTIQGHENVTGISVSTSSQCARSEMLRIARQSPY